MKTRLHHENQPEKKHLLPHRQLHAKTHLIVGAILLLLAFFGVILTDWQSQYTHAYWSGLAVVFALSSLSLSWLTSRKGEVNRSIHLWRELLHWLALILSIYLVGLLKEMGFFSTPVASLVALELLALTTFLAGVHFDCMFLLIGLFLGLITLLSVLFIEYLSLIAIPILAIIFLAMWWHFHHKSHAL